MTPALVPYACTVPLDKLVDPAVNPNRMHPDDFVALRRAVAEVGRLQPPLVRPLDDGRYEVVDGVHRCEAMRAEGVAEVDCYVVDVDESRAAALRISMNRLRGQLDLSVVSDVLAGIGDVDFDLALYAGLPPDALAELLAVAEPPPDPIDEGLAAPPDPEPESALPKPFSLELEFATADELRRVRRALRRAAGKGAPLERGLLNIINAS